MESERIKVAPQKPSWPEGGCEERLKNLKVRLGVVRKNRVYFDSADYYKTVWYNKLHALAAVEGDVCENTN